MDQIGQSSEWSAVFFRKERQGQDRPQVCPSLEKQNRVVGLRRFPDQEDVRRHCFFETFATAPTSS